MPKKDCILNIPSLSIKKCVGVNPLTLEVNYRRKAECIHCGNRQLRKKSRYVRRVWDESIGMRRTLLLINAHKYHCRLCNRYFNQRFPGILPYQRSTERLKEQVYEYHTRGVSNRDLAEQLDKGKATIERWYHQYYQREHAEQQRPVCPKVLGIDEHFFSRKQGYATTLCDLEKHKVFDIVLGRSQASLHEYLSGLKGRHRVRLVCLDLSVTYRSIVKRYFPNAKIVADRFHVIRLMQHMFGKVYQQLDPGSRYQRGTMRLLHAREDKLSDRQHTKRAEYLAAHPAVANVFRFKEKVYQLLMKKHCKVKYCKRLIRCLLRYVEQLKASGFKALQTLGKTINNWLEPIACMWRFTKNNGITEGFHRKMTLIQRRAYGFRNFENYRLRVKVLCS